MMRMIRIGLIGVLSVCAVACGYTAQQAAKNIVEKSANDAIAAAATADQVYTAVPNVELEKMKAAQEQYAKELAILKERYNKLITSGGALVEPTKSISFIRPEAGRLTVVHDAATDTYSLKFDGNVDEAAKAFFDAVGKLWAAEWIAYSESVKAKRSTSKVEKP